MRRRLLLLLAVLVAGVLQVAVTAPAQAAGSGQRAVWVWSQPKARTLVDFARQNGVQDVFVHTPPGLATSGSLGWYQELRTRTRAAGIRLHALGSATGWIDEPSAALAWQRGALATGLFDGVHLDVEPWLHAEWSTDRTGVVTRYLDLLATLAADTAVRVEADIAFWLDEVPTATGQRLDAAVLERVDAVTVMSYRDTVSGPDSITDVAADALAAGAAAGKPVRLAVETNDLGSDPVSQKQTFYGSSMAQLATAMGQVDAVLGGHPAYAGIGVHDYTGWTRLRR